MCPRSQWLVLLCLLLAGRAFAALAPTSTVAEVRAAGWAAAQAGVTNRLSGVVTYLRATDTDCNFVLDDGTGGLMVYPTTLVSLVPGQRVAVLGRTGIQRHGLQLSNAEVEPGEPGLLPKPIPTTLDELQSGRLEGRFVEVEGVVHLVRLEEPGLAPQRLAIDLGPRSRRTIAWVTRYPKRTDLYPAGSRVRLRGVSLSWRNARLQPMNTGLLVNGTNDIVLLAPAPEPRRMALAEALLWNSADEGATPVAVEGIVTLHRPGELTVVQAGDRAIRVLPAPATALGISPEPKLEPGQVVVATGHPAYGDYTVQIEDARLKPSATRRSVEPEEFNNAADVLKSPALVDRDGRLVRLDAEVRVVRDDGRETFLEMNSAGTTFSASLPAGLSLPAGAGAGAKLRLTGVCSMVLTPERKRFGLPPAQFALLVPDSAAITVLQAAPWWTRGRLATVLAVSVLMTALAAAWAVFIAKRNQRLQAEIAARMRAEAELSQERRRVAGELHDTLDQTLLAADLQLNAAQRLIGEEAGRAKMPVVLAHQLVARGRQEVRDAVWDLHSGDAEHASLADLLAKVCSEAEASSGIPVRLVENMNGSRPGPMVATQVVRLVREAVMNSTRHSGARAITVSTRVFDGALRIEVTDNGRGFDPTIAAGPDTGHFGLTGMRERARRLGGELSIEPNPGGGVVVRAVIPLQRA